MLLCVTFCLQKSTLLKMNAEVFETYAPNLLDSSNDNSSCLYILEEKISLIRQWDIGKRWKVLSYLANKFKLSARILRV